MRRPGWDVACCLAGLGAAAVVVVLGAPQPWRVMGTAIPMLVAPGYLVLRASAPRAARAWQAVVAPGVSLPVVGLAALVCVQLPGGFDAGVTMALVLAASTGCAGIAWVRSATGAGLAVAKDGPEGATTPEA